MIPTTQPMASRLSDADMQAVPRALLRAAQRARELARQTGTPLVLVRDGVLMEVPPASAPAADAEPAPPTNQPT